MRFSQAPKLIESVVALDFLESMNKPRQLQKELLRDVGDKSLLFCGLFPGIAEKKHVNLRYFSDMGQTAYLIVGELHHSQSADLYFQLSSQFITLQQILQAMCGKYVQFGKEDRGIISPIDLILQ